MICINKCNPSFVPVHISSGIIKMHKMLFSFSLKGIKFGESGVESYFL